jgi:hypothetical protein
MRIETNPKITTGNSKLETLVVSEVVVENLELSPSSQS